MNPDDHSLFDIDPDALRAAEFMQVQELLTGMVGKQIVAAQLDETRITVELDDGAIYYFYGFMGEDAQAVGAAG